MVTEVVEIVVRERGARATSNAIGGIGSAAAVATGAVTALVGALGAIAAFRGLTGLISESIQVSASFEQMGVRLRALLGSQQEANTALDNFTRLASKTPFSVQQVVEGAATLAAAALGNRERLEELTQTAANLAAVTGLSFQEAAGNLQRALSAGIGAADLFRDRGVRALIESIAGIPDATKLSTQELERIFLQVFGPGGTFGTAAEDLSNTLGGALSNIDDAFINLRKTIGDVFKPAVINAARNLIIPFLERLQKLISENEGDLRDFAARGLKAALQALVTLVRVGLSAAESLDALFAFVRDGVGAFLELSLSIAELNLSVNEFGNAIGLVSDEELAKFQKAATDARTRVDGLAGDSFAAAQRTTLLKEAVKAVRTEVDQFATALDNLGTADLPAAGQDVQLPTGGTGERETAEQLRERESAQQRVLTLLNQQRVALAQQVDPLQAQVVRLQQAREELERQVALAGESAEAAEARRLIDAQILAVQTQQAELGSEYLRLQGEIATLTTEIAASSPELAEGLALAVAEALKTGQGLEDIVRRLRQIRGEAAATLQREQERVGKVGERIGEGVAEGIGSAMQGLLQGDVPDFADTFAGIMADAVQSTLAPVIQNIGKELGQVLSGQGAGGLGDALGKLFTGGAGLALGLGAAATLVTGALRDTSVNVSNDLARSTAVQDVQATRGVVAGPTSIPIFEIGDALEDALTGVEQLLTEIRDGILRGSAAPLGSADLDGAAGTALGRTSPTIF